MENQKNNGGLVALVIILCLLVLGLGGYIVYDKVLSNKETPKNNTTNNDNSDNENVITNEHDIYSKGSDVTLNDGSKWIVLSDSGANQDYVTVIANKTFTEEFKYTNAEAASNEIYNIDKVDYKDSYIRKELENYYLPKISARLKDVDGYKIRLISLEEILNLNDGWVYEEEFDSYTYTGTEQINESVIYGLTMTSTKCTSGKCTPFYVTGSSCESYDNQNNCEKQRYFIGHWTLGLVNLSPVINVYKTEISK